MGNVNPIQVEDVKVATASIEVQSIKVNNRNMTLSMFKQIQEEDILYPYADFELMGKPWGKVNYNAPAGTVQVLWQKGSELRRCILPDPILVNREYGFMANGGRTTHQRDPIKTLFAGTPVGKVVALGLVDMAIRSGIYSLSIDSIRAINIAHNGAPCLPVANHEDAVRRHMFAPPPQGNTPDISQILMTIGAGLKSGVDICHDRLTKYEGAFDEMNSLPQIFIAV